MFRKYLGKYRDVLVGLLLIPVINTINYHLTYSVVRWDWYTLATYSIDTVSGFISWAIIKAIILWLDQKIPYDQGMGKRLAIQIALTTVAVLAFTIAATEGVNALYTDKPIPLAFYTYNLFIFFIWILVINGIYIGMYFHNQWRLTQNLRDQDKQVRQEGFQVQRGSLVIQLQYEEIAMIYVESGQTYLKNTQGETFALDRSLNQIGPRLPEELFFRVNRGLILNRSAILGFVKKPHGKLSLQLRNADQLSLSSGVSRLTAPSFKAWWSGAVDKL